LCADITAPVIVCPASIEAETAKDESVGHVEWRVPAAVDNSGFQPTVTVIPALVPPVLLPIGNHTITYTAEDSNKNKARCTFAITVRGPTCQMLARFYTRENMRMQMFNVQSKPT